MEVYLDLLARGGAYVDANRATLVERAERGHRLLARFSRTYWNVRPRASLLLGMTRRLQGRHREARRAFEKAARIAGAMPMPFELARAQRELARDARGDERRRLLAESASVFGTLGATYYLDKGLRRHRPMMTPQEMRETLDVLASRPSPFSDFRRELQSTLLSVMRVVSYQVGDYLIRQGEPGEYLLLILEGTAAGWVRQATGNATPIAEFSAGAVVGEISLLMNEPRTADVIASTPVRALFLSAADFHRLAEAHPELRVVLTYVLADRLGRSSYDGLSGKDIHGYRIRRCVGRGGMGIVYEGASLATGNTVALKMMNHALLYQPAALKRFRREAEALRSFQHPSIARLYDHFAAYKTEFLVMEFCEGVTLDRRIASHGRLLRQSSGKSSGSLRRPFTTCTNSDRRTTISSRRT